MQILCCLSIPKRMKLTFDNAIHLKIRIDNFCVAYSSSGEILSSLLVKVVR